MPSELPNFTPKAAAGAKTGGSGWLDYLIMALPSLLQLFQGKDKYTPVGSYQTQQNQSVTTPPSGYQDPMLGMYSMLTGNMLGQNMMRYANMGFPAGQGLDTSWITQMLGFMGPEWEKLMAGMKDTRAPAQRIKDSSGNAPNVDTSVVKKKVSKGGLSAR